ncbi:molybdopterin-dependent oxidoreductase, partial [bacterium]|nr:molybdopterin-dependent oxidoreductase [bacterium]MBU1025594.1 molybdopterin-dependent oxidoreductase [bacterium]
MKITIDDVTYKANQGQTVLDVARENGVYIPALCWHPRTGKAGRCRACVVEVDGAPGLKEACILEVRDGMVIHNSSPRVINTRKMIVNLLLADNNINEMLSRVGSKNELAEMAFSLGISHPDITIDSKRFPLDESSAGIVFNPNICISCGRCVASCNDNVMHEVLDFGWRGNRSKVIMDDDRPMGDSTCVQCGECVQVCPVPALNFKNAIEHANTTPIEKKRVICPYCGVGCALEVHLSGNRWLWSTAVEENWVNLPNRGMLCVKGRFGFDYVNHSDRLTSPLIKENGKFENVSWDEALDLIASKFLKLKQKHKPGSFACFSSAKCTNEENYLMNRFARGVMHTNNIDHCARLCHSSSVAAVVETLGSGAMTNSMQEATDSDVIFVIGSNPTWNHPVFGGALKNAVKKHGVKLIVADPRRTDLVECADIYLNLKNGSDVALLMGMCHIIVRENWIDQKYIDDNCEGWDAFKKSLDDFTPDFSERITGIPKEKIHEAAKLFAASGRAAIYWGMGISQHTHGTDNAKAIVNLSLITGNIGIKGGGVNPLRGQNNVQGASDMGALPDVFSGYQNVTEEDNRRKFAEKWAIDPAEMDS